MASIPMPIVGAAHAPGLHRGESSYHTNCVLLPTRRRHPPGSATATQCHPFKSFRFQSVSVASQCFTMVFVAGMQILGPLLKARYSRE